MLLEGKVVLITGAARGIGRAVATVMAEEGAAVGLADRAPEVEATAAAIAALGRPAAASVFDVADPAAVERGVGEIRRRLGDVQVLVNNAGIVNNIAPIPRMTHDAWEREISVNLTGAFNLIQAVVGPMIERKWGRIINVSSVAATGGLHNQAAYAASKAGLIGLTQTATLELARHGITCNAVLPGLIGTENVQQMPQEIREAAVATVPAHRLGETREIAYLIAFLASERAAFINGAAIPIDGGFGLNTLSLGSRKEVAAATRPQR
ncbi:MAG: SDR family oxidoreductase [Deltaproteobacteria bacterium]|nr:SDR family oxidoreductase [Deltaproteobacteria bacterium]